MMQIRKRVRFLTRRRRPLSHALACCLMWLSAEAANACLTGAYERLSAHCQAEPIYERMLKVVFGDLAEPRQIAVIAGVSEYPNLSSSQQLPPVDHDIEMLSDLAISRLRFDEVIVLKNGDFSPENLRHIFSVYLPDLLLDNPKSRVLFAFSGHGANLFDNGYLFLPETETITPRRFSDIQQAIGLDELKIMLRPTIHQAQHFLALINSCHGGSFLNVGVSFGSGAFDESGAQAITAGGADDLVHAYESVGEGSVFFEMVAAALSGRPIAVGGERFDDPSRGSGILTATDLADYLIDTIRIIEDQKQSPRFGSLTGNESGRQGEFFFIVDEEQARETFARNFPQGMQRVFGESADTASSAAPGAGTWGASASETDVAAATVGEPDTSPDTTIVPCSRRRCPAEFDLLQRFERAGISYSVSESEILGWLANPDSKYSQFGLGIMRLLGARDTKQPIAIDVAFWYYEVAGGQVDTTVPDGALDADLARAALVSAYNSKYGTSAASLDAILAPCDRRPCSSP